MYAAFTKRGLSHTTVRNLFATRKTILLNQNKLFAALMRPGERSRRTEQEPGYNLHHWQLIAQLRELEFCLADIETKISKSEDTIVSR